MMRIFLALLGLSTACTGDNAKDDSGTSADADTDADTDSDTDTDTDTDTDADPMTEAMLRVLHLGQGAPAVDIFVDGATPPAATLAFPSPDDAFDSGTAYLTLASGPHDIAVSAAKEGIDQAILEVMALPLAVDTTTGAAAVGFLSQLDTKNPANNGPFALQIITVSEDATKLNGQTRLTLVHAGAGIGPVDVRLDDGDADPKNDPRLADNLAFGSVAATPVEYAPAAVRVYIDASPNNGTNDADFVFDVPDVGESANTVYVYNEAPDGTPTPQVKVAVHRIEPNGTGVAEPTILSPVVFE
ncbi:MAG: DUF4397 domain-containing protein [Myxococcota bacterium]